MISIVWLESVIAAKNEYDEYNLAIYKEGQLLRDDTPVSGFDLFWTRRSKCFLASCI